MGLKGTDIILNRGQTALGGAKPGRLSFIPRGWLYSHRRRHPPSIGARTWAKLWKGLEYLEAVSGFRIRSADGAVA